MRRRIVVLLALGTLLVFALAPASASALSAKLDYHIADAYIGAGTGISQAGARAEADNGDIVSVSGAGTFNLGSGKTTGGGTFLHTDSDGVVQGSGTWAATGVDDFDFYGCGTGGLPVNFCGGALTLDVHLVAAGGAVEFDGVLRVDCLIGTAVPGGAVEGIMLDIPGAINFDETIFEPSGLTLYVSHNKNG
jgi:hypothetical protein